MGFNRSSRRIASWPTDMYRVYGAHGVLLYVGIAINVFERLRQHKPYSAWWDSAVEGVVTRYPSRSDAHAAEQLAIRTEKPLYNVTLESGRAEFSAPIEVFTIFWQAGEVWVDAA